MTTSSGRTLGRPPRFEPATERAMIVDAALKLLRTADLDAVTVNSILSEAGLSTRSFYRHFTSKDELLMAIYRDNAERTARALEARVAAAGDPRAGLEAWIDEMLHLQYDRRRAQRVAMFRAASARWAGLFSDADRAAVELLVAPLRALVAAGRADGTFPLADPERDPRSVYALVWQIMDGADRPATRAEACEHVLRFALGGMGGR